jgi:FkbM family methyltransferase
MVRERTLRAGVIVSLDCPDEMLGPTAAVLSGEYESGHSGEKLTVLDIGANVGAFTLWANMRWPGSTIHAYEPHPGTFPMLARNVATLPNVVLHNEAVFPGGETKRAFYSRYPGDGEAGLVEHVGKIFAVLDPAGSFDVPVVSPTGLPTCDVIKLDVEGAEADILEAMDVTAASLILLEYHSAENRRRIERKLSACFSCVHHDSSPWKPLLSRWPYHKELAGDRFGHLFFANRRANKLRKVDLEEVRAAERTPLRKLLAALPGAAAHAVGNRLRRRFGR